MSLSGRVTLLAAAAILGATSGAPPIVATGSAVQNAPGQPFRTAANYVRVDVYATAKGVPVLDLDRSDFIVTEDGVPQPLDAFERILVRGGTPSNERRPQTVAESRALVAASRARLFVLFLDVNHVEMESSRSIRQPLVSALEQMIGPDDLVAVMTPEMSAADVTFDRSPESIERLLSRHWDWGERAREQKRTPREESFQACYPGLGPRPSCQEDDRGVADEMIERFREQETLEALDNLVDHLRDMRDERKAVLVISDGWRLFEPNPSLARRVNCNVPMTMNPIDPATGRRTTKPRQPGTDADLMTCEADRMEAAQLNNEAVFRTLLDRANRSNVSFYSVDPRGLVVFDTPIDNPRTGRSQAVPSIAEDATRLRARQSALRDMAAATDGLAVLNSNDLQGGLTRIAADLSSYYLLSYYSTGKLDGKFHAINVRVTRPGVEVRARRGYLAATMAEVQTAVAAPRGAGTAAAPSATLATAVSGIAASARDMRLKVAAASAWPDGRSPRWWVAGEVNGDEAWRRGGQVIATLSTPTGDSVTTARTTIPAGARSFRLSLAGPPSLAAGEYSVQVRAQPAQSDAAAELVSAAAALVAMPGTSGAVLSRRGVSTGNKDVPAVDVRFRRSERLRADLVDVPATAVTARLVDRNGKELPVPVNLEPLTDDDGVRWQSVQFVLAPLAVGDYVIEIIRRATDGSGTPEATLVPFRIVP